MFAGLKKLARAISPEEFKVDEKPAEVIDVSALVEIPGTVTPGTDAAETDGEVGEARQEPVDLVTSVSLILAEQGRLAEIARELKPAGAGADEFGQFARDAIAFIDSLEHIVQLGRDHDLGRSEELSGWFQSVEALQDRILRTLEKYDLRVMNCLGQKVDFGLHDVIEYRRTRDYPHNSVVREIRKGIVFRGRILRDAKVVVACNDESAHEKDIEDANQEDSGDGLERDTS